MGQDLPKFFSNTKEEFKFCFITNEKHEILHSKYRTNLLKEEEKKIIKELKYVIQNKLPFGCIQKFSKENFFVTNSVGIPNLEMIKKIFVHEFENLYPKNSKEFDVIDEFASKPNEFVEKIKSKMTGREFVAKGVTLTKKDYNNFEKGLDLTLTLNHQNIVKNYCWFKEDYEINSSNGIIKKMIKYYLIMNFESKGDLTKNFINFQTTEDYLNMVRQICSGLSYLHSKKIMHRDIKPQNVLVSENGILKLCDLEFLRETEGGGTRTFVGTPGYIAPETITGNYTEKIDIFSLGVLILQMYVKQDKLKFMPEKKEILKNMKKYDPILHEICSSCLETEAKDRMSADDIVSFIDKKLKNETKIQFQFESLTDYLTVLDFVNCEKITFSNDKKIKELLLKDKSSFKLIKKYIKHHNKYKMIEHRCSILQSFDINLKSESIEKLKRSKNEKILKMLGFCCIHLNEDNQMISLIENSNIKESDIIKYFENSETTMRVKYRYSRGCILTGVLKNTQNEIFSYFEELNEKKYFNAKFYLGFCYYLGIGTKTDFGKAVELFKNSSEKGELYASAMLGICYLNGEGVEIDLDSSIYHLQLFLNEQKDENFNYENVKNIYQKFKNNEYDSMKEFEILSFLPHYSFKLILKNKKLRFELMNPYLDYFAFYLNREKDSIMLEAINEMITKSTDALYFGTKHIGDKGCEPIAAALMNNNSLERLILWNNSISDEGCCYLMSSLMKNHWLKELNLKDNEITSESCKSIANMLSNNKSLQSLDLSGNKIGNSGCEIIASALENNNSLKYLNLHQSKKFV
eukprot:gene3567-6302_t